MRTTSRTSPSGKPAGRHRPRERVTQGASLQVITAIAVGSAPGIVIDDNSIVNTQVGVHQGGARRSARLDAARGHELCPT